jgi:hypothetical protein
MAIKYLSTFFDKHDDVASSRAAHEQQLQDLYAQIGRLTSQLTWIKKLFRFDHFALPEASTVASLEMKPLASFAPMRTRAPRS